MRLDRRLGFELVLRIGGIDDGLAVALECPELVRHHRTFLRGQRRAAARLRRRGLTARCCAQCERCRKDSATNVSSIHRILRNC